MHVYHFNFLQQAHCLFSDSELMKASLWHYDSRCSSSGERLYSELNTGDFWKLGVDYVSQRASLPTADNVLPHYFCPIILFIDATLADRIGRLKVEPVLCSFGNICGEKRCLASSWFILGFIPPYPKSSVEAAADHIRTRKNLLFDRKYVVRYHGIFLIFTWFSTSSKSY
jgi:Plavaka transposase